MDRTGADAVPRVQRHAGGAGKVLVGTTACRCGQAHRTHFCRSCESTLFSPALGPQCLLLAMDERNMRAELHAEDDQAAP